MSKPAQTYRQHAPRVGQLVSYRGEPVGTVTLVDGALCWRSYPDGASLPFIWCFHDGLNALHDWPSKAGGKVARCPGVD